MRGALRLPALLVGAGLCLVAQPLPAAPAALLPVEEFRLDNGMRFLLVPRPGTMSVAAGWAVRAGSADEAPGRTGMSHLLEHLMFKGSRVVSARNPAEEEKLLAELDRVAEAIRKAKGKGGRERRLGELEARFEELQSEARDLAFLGELGLFYSQAGATGLNANTLEDLTMFYVTVPAEKLELWFWLESDRLLQPVFREFYKERRVVLEERKLRIDSVPAGPQEEELRALFWGSHPYAWRPLGRPEDVARIGREEARRHFTRFYNGAGLAAVLVGDLEIERVKALARRYFGRLAPGPPAEPAAEARALPEGRREMTADCSCPPQARVLYASASFRHPDSFALQVLAGLLNGRTGRLYRSLVLERQVAYSASVLQHPLRRAGYFSFIGEARAGNDPASLLGAWEEELERLISEPIPPRELQKVKNQITADAYRRLQDPSALMRQLLIYETLGDWRHINDWPEKILAVTGPEVRAAAQRHLRAERSAVALFYRPGTRPGAARPAVGAGPASR